MKEQNTKKKTLYLNAAQIKDIDPQRFLSSFLTKSRGLYLLWFLTKKLYSQLSRYGLLLSKSQMLKFFLLCSVSRNTMLNCHQRTTYSLAAGTILPCDKSLGGLSVFI